MLAFTVQRPSQIWNEIVSMVTEECALMNLETDKYESLLLTSRQQFTSLMLNGRHLNLFWFQTKAGKKPVLSIIQSLKGRY